MGLKRDIFDTAADGLTCMGVPTIRIDAQQMIYREMYTVAISAGSRVERWPNADFRVLMF